MHGHHRSLTIGLLLALAQHVLQAQGSAAGSARGRGSEPPNALARLAASEPSWSRDGKRIAFSSDRDGNNELYVMNADGSDIRRLTNNPAPDHYPVWSPDGTQIAFSSYRDGKSGVYVMHADGSAQHLLVPTFTTGDNPTRPTWSPDGARLAFTAQNNGASQIMVVNRDGTNVTKLAGTGPDDGMPAWAPDGKRIAFVSRRGGNADVFVTSVDGAGVRRVTRDTSDETGPTWSPDGKRIAYVSDRLGHPNLEIFVENLDDDRPTAINVTKNSDWETYAEWSPVDPDVMLEVSLRDGVIGVYVLNLRGGAPRWLTGPKR